MGSPHTFHIGRLNGEDIPVSIHDSDFLATDPDDSVAFVSLSASD